MSREGLFDSLEHWYSQFQRANCSLGYVAEQLGIRQVDFIYLLDLLGWKVTNL
jgi:hypothetical protein